MADFQIQHKICSKCGIIKDVEDFSVTEITRHGLGKSFCKSCNCERERLARLVNPEKFKKRDTSEKRKQQKNLRYAKNPELFRNRRKQWVAENPNKAREAYRKWERKKRATCPEYRVIDGLKGRIRGAIKNVPKSGKTADLVGCSVDQLLGYIEIQFQERMTWENYGEWHVDHKKPCASFNLNDPEQQKQCFNYKNLQPLWAEENLRKGCKIY